MLNGDEWWLIVNKIIPFNFNFVNFCYQAYKSDKKIATSIICNFRW